MRILSSTLFISSIALSTAFAAVAPPVSITVKSYNALEEGAGRIINAVAPGMADMFLAEFRKEIGMEDLKGVDKTQPWQAVIWMESASQDPSVSIRIPVTDYDVFKEGFDISELTDDEDDPNSSHGVSQVGDYAVIWIEEANTSGAVKDSHSAWKPEQLANVGPMLEIAFQPGEPLRNELLGLVGVGRMMIGGALSEQDEEVIPGMDPKVIAELVGFYFEVIEKGIRGVERLGLALDVTEDAIILDESIATKAGTELETWLKGGGESLDDLLPYLDNTSQAAFAVRFGDAGGLMPLLQRYMALSYQIMGSSADDPIIVDTNQLLEDMVPAHFAGVMNFNNGVEFGGAYRFPGKDVNETYAKFKKFMTQSMQSVAGEDKAYKEISFKENARTVDGVKVDEATMVMNLEAPMYQQPGQKEMVDMIWNGGRIVFDYATKGDHLLIGTREGMDKILAGPRSAYQPTLEISPDTVAYARLNLVDMIPSFLAGNPMMPQEMKDGLAQLDSTGTDVAVRVNLSKGLYSRTSVPLKLISTVAKFAAQVGQAE